MAQRNQSQDPHSLTDDELYRAAVRAWRDNQDYDLALQYTGILAERDNADGMTLLGVLYQQGQGVNIDLKKAQYYWTRSAMLGSDWAQFNLGYLYSSLYKGEEENLPLAEYWYEQAANQGDSDACFHLGNLFQNDDRIAHDEKKAFFWFKKGASFGHLKCIINLGVCYVEGKGTEQDKKQGADLMLQAAEKGNSIAQYNMGQYYRTGVGVKQDIDQAIGWYSKAGEQGDADAMYLLGSIYENGSGVKPDLRKALAWYNKAKKNGNEKAEEGIQRIQGQQKVKTEISSQGFKSTIGSLKDQQPRATDNLYIDLALCVDLTPVMPGLMSSVKRQIKELPKKIEEECANKGMGNPVIRARLIVFKDCHRDSDALRITDFYTLPSEKASFESAVDSLEANGASVYRSGLEAIMYAMCSKWEERKPNRQVVIIWAKGDTRQIGVGYEASKNMPKSFYQLSQYWGKNGSPSAIMNPESKRLIMLTPSETEWNKITSNWDNTLHIPCRAGEGIQIDSRKFEEVVSFIVR